MSILITKDTTFIIQGITGREAVNLTRENLAYGAKIVGGVTPGRAGRDVYGVPVHDCVRDITRDRRVDGESGVIWLTQRVKRVSGLRRMSGVIRTIRKQMPSVSPHG